MLWKLGCLSDVTQGEGWALKKKTKHTHMVVQFLVNTSSVLVQAPPDLRGSWITFKFLRVHLESLRSELFSAAQSVTSPIL